MNRPILAAATVLILAAVPIAAQQPEQIPEPESPLRAIPERLLESPPILQSRELQKSQPTANGPQVLIPLTPPPPIIIVEPPDSDRDCELERRICEGIFCRGPWPPPIFGLLPPTPGPHTCAMCRWEYEACKSGHQGPVIRW